MSSRPSAADLAALAGSWMPVTVLVLGTASLLMLLGTNWIRERLVTADTNRVQALVDVQLEVATVHLWLEEYVSGDEVDTRAISRGLDRAQRWTDTLIDGGPLGESGLQLPPLREPALRARALEVRNQLDSLADLYRARELGFQIGDDVGIGSALDTDFDRVFGQLKIEASALESALRQGLLDSSRLATRLFRVIVLAWVVIVALAVAGLWTHERRRRKAVAELAQTQEQLAQAQKMEAVGRLAGGITHDINNYLAAITTNCELVQMESAPESRTNERMSAVLAVVGKATDLIDRLLAFARRQPVEPVVINLNTVVEGLEPMARQLLGAHTQLRLFLSRELWNTEIDPTQVEQILVNLLVNAHQAMPTGGGVTIETDNSVLDEHYAARHALVAAGEYVVLVVSDTGPGIPREIEDKIFEPFFTTRDEPANSGLGLSTVFGIVQQNGGHIWVYSEPGHGASFRIYLPRSAVEARPLQPGRGERVRQQGGGSERILLVEDNEDFRGSLRALLEGLGYQVAAAADGREALECFARHGEEFDMLITDVVMPGMSGRVLADELLARDDSLKVLFMSGYTENVILHHGFGTQHVNLLQKPFSAVELACRIRAVLAAPAADTGSSAAR